MYHIHVVIISEREYRENEVVSNLKNGDKKFDPCPHHLQIIFGHENGLISKVDAHGFESITVCKYC